MGLNGCDVAVCRVTTSNIAINCQWRPMLQIDKSLCFSPQRVTGSVEPQCPLVVAITLTLLLVITEQSCSIAYLGGIFIPRHSAAQLSI